MTRPPNLESWPAAPESRAEGRAYDEVMHCNRCGFCTSFCPTYLATGEEGLSPRGRNQSWRALLEGRLDPAAARRSFETCLLCGLCTSVCFAQVPTARLMSQARQKVRVHLGSDRLLRFFLRRILPRPALFEGLLKILYLFKRVGLSRWLNRLGLLGWMSPPLAAAEEWLEEPPKKFLRDLLPPAPRDAQVIHFLACGPNCLRPEVGRATAHLLQVRGVRAGSAETVCCGLLGKSFGDESAARALAKKNIKILERYPQAVVLIDDSSCAAAIKEWPRLFEEDAPWRARAETVVRRSQDLLEWIGPERGDGFSSEKSRVTYHDACQARHAQGLVKEPRQCLKSLADVEYRELPEADQCCGGGGAYAFLQPEISRSVGERKADRIAATGAEMVLTSSVSCLLQLRAMLKAAQSKVRVLHVAEFLASRTLTPRRK